MKRFLVMLSLSIVSCGAPSPLIEPTIKLDPGTASIDSTVTNVKVGKGPVYCALHIAAEGFPGPSPIIGGSVVAEAETPSVKCLFSGLPAGTYAVSVFQDENSNGKTDTNVFGAPTEGYGASKNDLPAASPPDFKDNQITLVDGQTLTLEINMR